MTERIGDAADARLDGYRNLAAPPENTFVAETERVLRRVLHSARDRIVSVLLSPSHAERLVAELQGLEAPVYIADKSVMSQVAGFQIHRGVLALVQRPPEVSIADLAGVNGPATLLVADQISDPSNLGALFRNAAAFSVAGVVLAPGCADPFYRKCVRVSVGHVLTVPLVTIASAADLDVLTEHGWELWAAELEPDAVDARSWSPGERVALVLGAEGEGVSPGIRAKCPGAVQIAKPDDADSLNVSTAAAVLLYQRTRQNRD